MSDSDNEHSRPTAALRSNLYLHEASTFDMMPTTDLILGLFWASSLPRTTSQALQPQTTQTVLADYTHYPTSFQILSAHYINSDRCRAKRG